MDVLDEITCIFICGVAFLVVVTTMVPDTSDVCLIRTGVERRLSEIFFTDERLSCVVLLNISDMTHWGEKRYFS